MADNDALKLENQLCFPLYACSREMIKKYRPLLDAIDLTYTQYVAMMVFWEERSLSVKALGQKLYLDSGTLTPVLKSLEQKGYITRRRSAEDERVLIATVTPEGEALKARAADIPQQVCGCVALEPKDTKMLKQLLDRLLHNMETE